MYVIVNLGSDAIEGTMSEPDIGEASTVNGKYLIPTPEGVALTVDSASYLTPQDADSIPGSIADTLLTRNPNYDHVLWNFFLVSADIALLDLSAAAPTPTGGNVITGTLPTQVAGSNGPRCQVGRGVGPAPVGVAPNSISIFGANTAAPSTTYGSLITDTIDLTPYTGASGSDEVMVWWKIAIPETTEDIVSGYNTTLGQNSPSIKTLEETEFNPPGFYAYASVDDGATWFEVEHLVPTDLITAGTDFRLAFVNESSDPIYLLGFIVLVAEAP
jgi:hypothetical protein